VNALKRKLHSQAGFTLIEILMTLIITTIALIAVSGPFMAERRFWSNGMKKAMAQRDAHMILRAMEQSVRESEGFTVTEFGDSDTLTLTGTCAPVFTGGPSLSGKLNKTDCNGSLDLVEGARSMVTEFNVSSVVADKLVNVRIHVVSDLMDEVLETQMYVRNG
jgi:prepilin-type N-terminal cleavage/methylation domain-containing protein